MENKITRHWSAGVFLLLMLACCVNLSAQRIRVQGQITDRNGKGVPNANVFSSEKKERIDMSDEDGRYSVLADKNASLKFTCIGYEDYTVKIGNKQIIDVVLKEAVFALDEVTVISKVKNKVVPEPTDIEIKATTST